MAFEKVIVDSRFVAEGVAVGDVNRDGRLDIVAGNVWYSAPDWKAHEIGPVATLDPKTQYSNCFHNWMADLDGDGWVDQILIGMPGEKAIWRENPKGKDGPWKEHPIWRSAGNESPLYEDLFGNGRKVLIMGTDDQYLAWFEPAADPYAEWVCHPVSELKGAGSQRYSHGLGVGDLDGDGRREILTTGGYYAVPSDPRRERWRFVKADLGPDCAHMLTLPRGTSKLSPIFTTSAHSRGVWEFTASESGEYRRHTLDQKISETHAAQWAKVGGSLYPNLVTGKRKWAHPPGVDVGSEEPSELVRYEFTDLHEGFGIWIATVIDSESGVGTQFVVRDMNGDGREDLVIANKNGVFLFWQKPKGR